MFLSLIRYWSTDSKVSEIDNMNICILLSYLCLHEYMHPALIIFVFSYSEKTFVLENIALSTSVDNQAKSNHNGSTQIQGYYYILKY